MSDAGEAPGAASPEPPTTSAGAKLLFGCLAVVVLGVLGLAAAVTVGGFALKRGIESTVGSATQHREAARTLDRVEEEHPFEPPENGVVGVERLGRFLDVTDDAWEEIRPWAEDLRELREAFDDTGSEKVDPLAALTKGARAAAGLARSRSVLASALEARGMSLAEYTWTGVSLERAARVAERGDTDTEGVPPANLRLVREHAGELPEFGDDDGSAMVLAVANMWGLGEGTTGGALGLDTLMRR